MQLFTRTLPVLIAFLAGLWFAVQYYVPAAWSDKTLDYAANWDKTLLGFAYALGLYSLCHMHWRRIRRAQPGFGYSILVYVGLGTMLYFGLSGEARRFAEIMTRSHVAHHVYVLGPASSIPDGATVQEMAKLDDSGKPVLDAGAPARVPGAFELVSQGQVVGWTFDPNLFACAPETMRVKAAEELLAARGVKVLASGEAPVAGARVATQVRSVGWYAFASYQGYDSQWGSLFTWQVNSVYNPAQSTMFSILAFFVASAAYRTFRARTVEAAFLLIAALVVIFGRTTLAGYLGDVFPDASDWIMGFPNLAAKRGILLGVALGSVATALRIIFGIERAYLGGD